MRQGIRRVVLLGVLIAAAVAVQAGQALASVAPALTLDQSAGTAAGSSTNLGVDLTFSPSSGDSPKELSLELPPGLLANAAIDGGACLVKADLSDSACQVGSGTVTADAFGTIPVPTPVTFDLVPPPKPGDLAGLAVNYLGSEIGSTGDIIVRPSGDPAGVGVTINMVLPNSLYSVPISITEINSTFEGLRYPTTCPATPQNFVASVTSYADSTVHTVSAPLSVSGCSALTYAPAFSVTAVRDSEDDQVALSSTVTQGAAEAPSQSVSLSFPSSTLQPNVEAVNAICPDPSTGTCTALGSVTATSPLYPATLTGQAYLTGSFAHPSLTLTFPPPFPLTLTGAVNLGTNTASFTGLPDIPLINLTVSLNGGADGVFGTTCKSPSGTATATLTDQNGDRTLTAPAKFTVSGCPGTGAGSGGKAKLTHASITGLSTGRPALGFKIAVPNGAAALRALSVALPGGLSFVRHRVGKRLTVTGVKVTGALVASLSLSHGRLVIKLRRPAAGFTVRIGPSALSESSSLRARAKARTISRLVVRVITSNTAGRRATIGVQFVRPGR